MELLTIFINDGAGYSIRYLHQEKVDKRLAAIEDSVSICCIIFSYTKYCLVLF